MDGNNTSNSDVSGLYSPEISIGLIILLSLFDIVSILANGMVLLTVYSNPRLRTNTNFFITNLCLVDLVAGCLLLPLVIHSIGRQEASVGVLCELVGFIDATYSCASSLTIAVIALDRYHSIVNCLYYENIVTRRRTIIAIVWIWFQTLVIALCPIVGWGKYTFAFAQFKCSLDLPDRYGFLWVMFCTSVVLPFIVIVFCYTQIHLVARRHAKNMVAIHIQDTGKRIRAVSTRKTKLVYLVVGIYTTCWLPIYIVKLLQSILPESFIPEGVVTLATVLSLINGSCNPFLYALITSQYRAGINRMNKRLRRKFGRTVATPSFDQSKSSWSVSRPISNLYRYFQENDPGSMLACIGRTNENDDEDDKLDQRAETSGQKYLNPKNIDSSPPSQRKMRSQTLQIPHKTKSYKKSMNGWVREGKNVESLSIPLTQKVPQDNYDTYSHPEVYIESKSNTRTKSLEKKGNICAKHRNTDEPLRKAVSFQNYLKVIEVGTNSALGTIKEVAEGDKHLTTNPNEPDVPREETTRENEEINEESETRKNEKENIEDAEYKSSSSDEKLHMKIINTDDKTQQNSIQTTRNPLDAGDNFVNKSRKDTIIKDQKGDEKGTVGDENDKTSATTSDNEKIKSMNSE